MFRSVGHVSLIGMLIARLRIAATWGFYGLPNSSEILEELISQPFINWYIVGDLRELKRRFFVCVSR